MNKKILIYPVGSILMLECGEYSNRCTLGVFVVINECNLPKLAKEYIGEAKDADWIEIQEFPSWLIVKGYLLPVNAQMINLGSHYSFSEELVKE
jgi:hypothetical protein